MELKRLLARILEDVAGALGPEACIDDAGFALLHLNTLSSALKALTDDPSVIGARERLDITANIWTLHVARQGHKGRHFVMFRVNSVDGMNVIDVLRLLHDSMDLERHLPSNAPAPPHAKPS